MADGDSLGADTQKRAWAFIHALLKSYENREGNPELGEIKIEWKNWGDGRRTGNPRLVVSAYKNDLLKIIAKQKKILSNLQFTEEHFSSAYNTWLAKGKPLDILEDLRQIKRGPRANLYKFELKLWSTLLEDNEREFNKAWKEGKQRKNNIDISFLHKVISKKCPYQGLFPFNKEDAPFFFGRDRFIKTLVKAVQEKPLVAVIGNSGIGKSSVVSAGLIPKLEELRTWKIAYFRPTNNPFFGLANALLDLFQPKMSILDRVQEVEKCVKQFKNKNYSLNKTLKYWLSINSQQRFLIVLDQFEELYTLCSEHEANKFLDILLQVIDSEGKKLTHDVTVLITLRADFYGYALSHPALVKALQKWKPEHLSNMGLPELKEAIEKPAQSVKLKIQDGLTQIILDAMKNEQGGLPLLEFTLEKLWEKCSGSELTISAYNEIGGVEKALANHAEYVYNKLDELEKNKAQHIFTQLVRFGENTNDTRRQATRDEIGLENWDLVIKLASVERDLKARLIITGKNFKEEPTVEVVHEALIREWQRLRDWMEKDREFRKWQDRLRIEKDIWQKSGKDNSALLRVALLIEAERYLKERRESITNKEEIEFIVASRQYQEQKDIEHIKDLLILSQKELQLKQQLSSLVIAVKAGRKLSNIKEPSEDLKINLIERLQQGSYEISEKNQLVGHQGEINGVAFSQDGLKIASASDDQTVRLWDLQGKQLQTFKHVNEVLQVSFSRDGQIIASAGVDRTVRLWSINGKLLRTLTGHSDVVWGVSFSPDGEIIASASADRTIKLWDTNGTLLRTLTKHIDRVRQVSFSPNGEIIASASADKTLILWSLDGRLLRTLKGHSSPVWGVSFSPDGEIIASASDDKTVKLWNLNGMLLRTLKGHSGSVRGVSFSPDGEIIASASSDRTVKLWSCDGTLLRTLVGHTDRTFGVSFSCAGQIASASADRTVKLWDIDGILSKTILGHVEQVRGVSFSPDGKIIASASSDKTLKLWDVNGMLLRTLKGHRDAIWGVSFSPDGKIIASASSDKTVRLWGINQKILRILEGHTDQVYAVSFSPDGKFITSASADKTVRLWDGNGRFLRTLEGHTDQVYGVSFSPNGKIVASASIDKTVRLWDVNGTLLRTLKGHTEQVYGVSFSPDGKIIASASGDRTVGLWDINGTLLKTLKGHNGQVWEVSFSPNGKIIASASVDRTVRLWSLDGTLLRTLEGHTDRVLRVDFSPNSQMIASASSDKTVRLWHIDPEDLILDPDVKIDNLLKKSCRWIKNYLNNNCNVSESDRYLCEDK